jgi:hypothetical protein
MEVFKAVILANLAAGEDLVVLPQPAGTAA